MSLGSGTAHAFDVEMNQAAIGRHGRVELWTALDGPPTTFTGWEGPVCSVRFSPDGTQLAASDGATFATWDVAAQKVLARIQLNELPTSLVELTNDRQFIVTSSGEQLKVHGQASSPHYMLPSTIWSIRCIGDTDLAVGLQNEIRIIDLVTGETKSTLPLENALYVQAQTAANDGRHLAAITSGTGQPLEVFRLRE